MSSRFTLGWIPYEAAGGDYVPVERWGQDHWNTLAYLETRAVDHRGIIGNANMRCHVKLHRAFADPDPFSGQVRDGSQYPTRLKDGELANHDDWSCVEDAVAAGLIEVEYRERYPSRTFGSCEARVRFTPAGLALVAALRAHKSEGGTFGTFQP